MKISVLWFFKSNERQNVEEKLSLIFIIIIIYLIVFNNVESFVKEDKKYDQLNMKREEKTRHRFMRKIIIMIWETDGDSRTHFNDRLYVY
jgi:hypothetical protein